MNVKMKKKCANIEERKLFESIFSYIMGRMESSIYAKFPSVLRSALEQCLVCFGNLSVEFEFASFCVFRRVKGTVISENDFKSQAELYSDGQLQRWPNNTDAERDIKNYSCSLFENLTVLKKIFNSKRNHFAKGILEPKHGAISRDSESTHVHCWLYEQSNIKENFEVVE
ncbi:MAG: hypothetical protein J6P84_00075 [Alphaproteobacteria bacterium]|nr:hypothetical protein [Alphaproteobacteria bacterium]